jgi:hypothetical protein
VTGFLNNSGKKRGWIHLSCHRQKKDTHPILQRNQWTLTTNETLCQNPSPSAKLFPRVEESNLEGGGGILTSFGSISNRLNPVWKGATPLAKAEALLQHSKTSRSESMPDHLIEYSTEKTSISIVIHSDSIFLPPVRERQLSPSHSRCLRCSPTLPLVPQCGSYETGTELRVLRFHVVTPTFCPKTKKRASRCPIASPKPTKFASNIEERISAPYSIT